MTRKGFQFEVGSWNSKLIRQDMSLEIYTAFDRYGFVAICNEHPTFKTTHFASPRQAAEDLAHQILGSDAHVTFDRPGKYWAERKPQFPKS